MIMLILMEMVFQISVITVLTMQIQIKKMQTMGRGDVCDNCPFVENNNQLDADNDGRGDVCDNCPLQQNNNQKDADGDGVGDVCDVCPGSDVDGDADGVPDGCDICPGFNDNLDADNDGIPDGCDKCPGSDDNVDSDSDGVADGCDNCPTKPNADQSDSDNDGFGDECDICAAGDDSADSDNDGVPDACDICAAGDDSADSDGDGIPDNCDNCPTTSNADQVDSDNNGYGDACDICVINDLDCSDICSVGNYCDPVDGCVYSDRDYNNCENNYISECTIQTCVSGQGCVIEPDVNYGIRNVFMFSNNGNDWVLKQQLSDSGEAELARGSSTDTWVGVAINHETQQVYVANSIGRVKRLENGELVQQVSTGQDLQDIDFAEGNLWVLYPSPSGDIVFSRVNIDSGALEFTVTTNIPMTSSASFAWDRFGYFLYIQTLDNRYRYDAESGDIEVLCGNENVESNGMYVDYSSTSTIASSFNGNVITFIGATSDCNGFSGEYSSGTQFDYYKFAASELCVAVVPPPVDTPQPVPPPPANDGDSGASAIFPGESDATAPTSPVSTTVVGLAGAGVVGFFAFFAVAIGLNNTKGEEQLPTVASLVDNEMDTIAHESPIFNAQPDAAQNIIHG